MPSKTWRLWGTGEVSFSKEKTVRKALRVRRAGRSGQDKNTGQQKSYMRKGATEQGEQRSQRAPTGEAQRSQVGERKRRAGSSLGLGGPGGHPAYLCWVQGEENLIIQEKCRAAPGSLFWFPEPNYYWHI